MITYNQLELVDVFKECQDFFETDKPQFLKLLEENVDLDSLIPRTFSQNYYAHTGRPRGYQLVSMLWALILQRILSIPTDSLLIVFLHYSKSLRKFCGFDKDLLTGETFGVTAEGSGIHFNKAYIPLNSRGGLGKKDYTVNEDGVPCCPNDPTLPMKQEGNTSHLRSGIPTFKFVCPKMKWEKDPETGKYHRQCHCENPCTTSECGRMIYVYPEQDLRTYPGTVRGTEEWKATYKIRTTVERTINHFKDSFGLAGRRTQNKKTLRADLYLSGITQLITVLLADKLHKHEYIRSVKSLVA